MTTLTLPEFEAMLQAERFDEILSVTRAPAYALAEHQHAFDACAYITAGAFTLVVGGVATRYVAGQVFRLNAGVAHEEFAGPEGASYRAGRRKVAV